MRDNQQTVLYHAQRNQALLAVILAVVAEQGAEGIELGTILEESVPVIVANLVSEVAE